MSEPYDFRPGGSLKLKGEKKKKKKSRTDAERSTSQDQVERAGRAVELRGEASTSSTTAQPTRKKTAAEEKYDQIQEERRRERAKKKAKMTHKDRVAQYNAALDRLSEHHDMPRIGPG